MISQTRIVCLLVALAVAITASPGVQRFDISEYVYGVDQDLQARARAAIEAETFSARSTNKFQEVRELDRNSTGCRVRTERPCPPSKYRSASGSCNNVRHPAWAARGSPFLKLLPPAFSDHVSAPRQSVIKGHSLPSSLDVVSTIRQLGTSAKSSHEALTSLAGLWADLVLEDIAVAVHPTGQNGACCSRLPRHPECFEILDNGDVGCQVYWRSVPSLTVHLCDFGGREQMNGASGYLDGSSIYGTNEDQVHEIRTYLSGQVRWSPDVQVLKKTILTEHNRLARDLSTMNPHWDDTKLFLEARRILVAELQHVTFNEFLPSVLGEVALVTDELKLVGSGYYSRYSSSNRGGAIDAVAFAALRALVELRTGNESGFGLVHHVTNPGARIELPFRSSNRSGDVEETAWLIHVARDHGIPGYTTFLAECSANKYKVQKFAELDRVMSSSNRELLESIYQRVEDIDLLLGGVLEDPTISGAVGPTFDCLLRHQFSKLRDSDRFWYENDIPPSSLTLRQLEEVRKVTLAGLLCSGGLDEVQPKAFLQEDSYLNSRISCDQVQRLSVEAWRDDPQPGSLSTSGPTSDAASTSGPAPGPGLLDVNPITNQVQRTLDLDPTTISAAVRRAEASLIQRKQLEYRSWLEQRTVDPRSPAGTAASFSKANKDALLLANSSILYELATNEILNGVQGLRRRRRQIFDSSDNVLGFPGSDFSDLLGNVDISGFLPQQKATNHEEVDCPEDDSPCDPTSPYRTLSGHCNNLRNPSLGKSLTTFARLLPPQYEDGVSKPRQTSVTGAPLPNPRVVSTVIHPDISNLHNRYTLMVMQFAQFLDHDLTMTPIHKGFAESIPSCRSCDSPRTVHPECHPFPVPPGDHHYPTVNVSSGQRMCFPSMRSLPGQQHLGPREQVNQNTGFLDASVVYGENTCIANVLRGFNGRMNVTANPHRGKDLLPQSATHPECKARSGYCFIGGDGRASEQPALAVMHTVFIREHNRILEGLRQANLHWDGEKLYQQTRRIIGATLQHITYNEFLPRILGWNAVSLYGLKLLPQGYYKEYSPTCNPSVLNEFAAAAFRIGHSLLRPHLPRMDRNYQPVDPPFLLRDGFFNPDMLYQAGVIDEMLRGLTSTPMETLDQFITGEVTNHLFEQKGIPHSGVDLIALNVHRARDHGIPSYNEYRALCNLKRATTFEDLSREMAPEVIARMKRIYASVDDIDLFPGGMSERPLQGGLVGPTFACIIAIQFRQARKCDRFWYETDDPNIRFTEHQLAEIRKVTLSKVICDNMDQHVDMQRAAFDLPSNFLNPRVPCSSMPQMDLGAWRETRHGCQIGGRNVAVGESGFPTPCTSCVCTAEGTQCASLRVTDCNQLLREASRDAILRDDVCTAQCGFVLAATEATSRIQFSSPAPGASGPFPSGFPRSPTRAASTPASFNGFKLPDLSQFIG